MINTLKKVIQIKITESLQTDKKKMSNGNGPQCCGEDYFIILGNIS